MSPFLAPERTGSMHTQSAALGFNPPPLALSPHLYLWTRGRAMGAMSLLITAHGGYWPIQGYRAYVDAPCRLIFYAHHGQTMNNAGLNLTLQSPVETVDAGQPVRNYVLQKFQERHPGPGGESYHAVHYAAQFNDILTIRNANLPGISPASLWRSTLGNVDLHDVFTALRQGGGQFPYEEIHCSFCRSSVLSRG